MFRSFFSTIFRWSSAVLCAVTISPADLRSLRLYYYAVCGRMCMSSVRVWCSCLLVITNRQEHQTRKGTVVLQMTYTCGHMLRNNTNCACLVFLSVGDHRQTRTPNTQRNCCITDDIHMRPHAA